jgi:hypothetical protein
MDEIINTAANTDNKGYKTCYGMLRSFRPPKNCLAMRGQSLPAAIRSATLTYFIAGPLGGIAKPTQQTDCMMRKISLRTPYILYIYINRDSHILNK